MPIPTEDIATAKALREELRSAGVSQDALAVASGYSRVHTNRILCGRHRLPLRLKAVAEVLIAEAPPPRLAEAGRCIARASRLIAQEGRSR